MLLNGACWDILNCNGQCGKIPRPGASVIETLQAYAYSNRRHQPCTSLIMDTSILSVVLVLV